MTQEASYELPHDLAACHELIASQAAEMDAQAVEMDAQAAEMEKLRKLLHLLVNGSRSEKRIVESPGQGLLPFESEEEYQAAQEEAAGEAKQIIEKYEVAQHERKKKRRSEALPADLPRVDVPVEVDDAIRTCATHGERTQMGEDIVETLVVEPPKAYVEVRRFPKFVCPEDKQCGVASPERPTGLTAGNRYSPSVAAAVVDYKWGQYLPIYRQQDLFAASGWTPHRSTLLNLVEAVEFVVDPILALMKRRVQDDCVVGIDDTSCRMLLPQVDPKLNPSDLKSVRLAEKLREARAKGDKSLLAKMWVPFTRGLPEPLTTSSIFALVVIAMVRTSSSRRATAKLWGTVFLAIAVWCCARRAAWSLWLAGLMRVARWLTRRHTRR